MPTAPAPLPLVPRLSCWLAACLDGRLGPDDFAVGALGDDVRHLVFTDTGSAAELAGLPSLVGGGGSARVSCSLPVPGDLLGLAGPPELNRRALDAGGAVLAHGPAIAVALVPRFDARTVLWELTPAALPPTLDPGEHDRTLRAEISACATRLAELEVARWRPEVAELLIDGVSGPALPPVLPPGVPARVVEQIARALWCLEIVALALEDEGGARSAPEMARRREALTGLDRAARRVLVSTCGTLG